MEFPEVVSRYDQMRPMKISMQSSSHRHELLDRVIEFRACGMGYEAVVFICWFIAVLILQDLKHFRREGVVRNKTSIQPSNIEAESDGSGMRSVDANGCK